MKGQKIFCATTWAEIQYLALCSFLIMKRCGSINGQPKNRALTKKVFVFEGKKKCPNTKKLCTLRVAIVTIKSSDQAFIDKWLNTFKSIIVLDPGPYPIKQIKVNDLKSNEANSLRHLF